MKGFFCTAASTQLGEELIGTAGHFQTYVLIECPQPWAADVLESKGFPPELRRFIKVAQAERSVQFLCIDRGRSGPISQPTVLIYERQLTGRFTTGFSKQYRGYEFQLADLTQVANCLESHWKGDRLGHPLLDKIDILVCTHGMRDKCCARFGRPFLREAQKMVNQANLQNIRLWQVSHIGGHRFAPTAITLPDGRYYGRLNATALHALLTRSGPVSQITPVYRGWGMLPKPLQVLEQQLLLSQGWDWLDQSVTYQILPANTGKDINQNIDKKQVQAELAVQSANNVVTTYRAKLVPDPNQTRCLKGSCSAAKPSTFVKYAVSECSIVKVTQPETVEAAPSKTVSAV